MITVACARLIRTTTASRSRPALYIEDAVSPTPPSTASGSSSTAYQEGASAARLTANGAVGSVKAVETSAPIAEGPTKRRNRRTERIQASAEAECRSGLTYRVQ